MAAKGDESSAEEVVVTGACGGIPTLQWRRRESLEDVELDAARALADFAEMALMEREGRGWGDGGGRRGGREEDLRRAGDAERWSRKRMKGEAVAGTDVDKKSLREAGDAWTDASSSPRHQQAGEAEDHHHHKQAGEHEEGRVLDSQSGCAVSHPASRGGKQNLSEAEKEARRLRRVLANRESARQTILRRKALCEELANRAAELSQENENMKMERDEAMKEYLSLRDRNTQLKEQVAKTAVECEIKEDPSCTTPLQPESPAPSSLAHGNPPFPQLAGPPTLKPPPVSLDPVPRCASERQVIRWTSSTLPRPSFPVPQRPWSCCTIPNYQPPLRSVRSTGHDGGGGPGRGGDHPIMSWMWDLKPSSPRGESTCAEGESSSKSMEAVPRRTHEHATDDTKVLKRSRTGAKGTLQPLPAASPALPTHPPRTGSTAPGAVAAPTPGGMRALAGPSTAAEARRRRRELSKLKHLHGWRGRPRG